MTEHSFSMGSLERERAEDMDVEPADPLDVERFETARPLGRRVVHKDGTEQYVVVSQTTDEEPPIVSAMPVGGGPLRRAPYGEWSAAPPLRFLSGQPVTYTGSKGTGSADELYYVAKQANGQVHALPTLGLTGITDDERLFEPLFADKGAEDPLQSPAEVPVQQPVETPKETPVESPVQQPTETPSGSPPEVVPPTTGAAAPPARPPGPFGNLNTSGLMGLLRGIRK